VTETPAAKCMPINDLPSVRVSRTTPPHNHGMSQPSAPSLLAGTVHLFALEQTHDALCDAFCFDFASSFWTIDRLQYVRSGRDAESPRHKPPFDVRHYLNGLIDAYLYESGRIDTSLPFDELRRRSLINEAANAAEGAPDFSRRIRAFLPTIPK
jgi:hypothetical protein